jgi:hypothetical protein
MCYAVTTLCYVCGIISATSPVENNAMKILGTIALVFVVIIAALLCLLSSTCVVSSGVSSGTRSTYALFALVSLAVAVGGAMLIAKINRKE